MTNIEQIPYLWFASIGASSLESTFLSQNYQDLGVFIYSM